MKKTILIILIITLSTVFLYSQDFWEKRGIDQNAKLGYEYWNKHYKQNKDFENSWKFARACYYYGYYYIDNKKLKLQIFEEGFEAAKAAIKQQPEDAVGYLYFAYNVGSWTEYSWTMQSLYYLEDILKALNKTIELEPSIENGSAYMSRGRLYHLAPKKPMSVGNIELVEKDYINALKYGPENRITHRYYAEYLLKVKKDKKQAIKYLEKALVIPYDLNNKPEEDKEITAIKKLLNKLKK